MGDLAHDAVYTNHDWYGGKPRRETYSCKHCGKKGLKWRWMEDGWRLYEQERGEHNRSVEHNCRVASADDFEEVKGA